ncbi:MAG: cytochrome c biogenesis protein ResB [Bacillota bacterium]
MIKLLSSIKLAVGLITALIIASIAATLFPQLDVFPSFWFRGLLILFCINLLVCTLKSVPGVYKRFIKVPAAVSDENGGGTIIDSIQPKESEKRLLDYLKAKGYKTKMAQQDGKQNILAQKGLLNLAAPHLLHISLIVVLLGGFISSFGTAGDVSCFVGEKAEVPRDVAGAGMVIEVNDFKTLYDNEDAIDNWVTDFNIYVNGEKVASGETKVNDPLKYKGVVFYQKSYGYNHIVEIKGEQEGTYSVPDGRIFKLAGQMFNINYTPEGTQVKFFEGHTVASAQLVAAGEKIDFSEETSLEYLQLHPFTVLGVKRDPGTWVVMTGFILMTLASAFFWTGRYNEVQVTINEQEKKMFFIVYCKSKEQKEDTIKELNKELQVN